MPAITVPRTRIQTQPGYLYKAIIGSTAPSNTVAGGQFTDTWPAAWIPIGVTKSGHAFSRKPSYEGVDVAEVLDELFQVATKVETMVEFEIAEYTAKNWILALNGGSLVTVSGTGATLLSKLSPPATGADVRTMIGWESADSTERTIWYQCLQTGEVKVEHKKGADNATLPVSFMVEPPATGNVFDTWFSGPTLGS